MINSTNNKFISKNLPWTLSRSLKYDETSQTKDKVDAFPHSLPHPL